MKTDLTNFFATRGITITTVGMFGGMTYENRASRDQLMTRSSRSS